jgi:tetratricopeptide (TPR) repeat protein
VTHRKGALYVQLRNFNKALLQYQQAAAFCSTGGDSLCLAISLEQMGSMNAQLNNFEEAHRCYLRAMPLLEQYGGDDPLSVTLINYASLLNYEDKLAEAILYYEKALTFMPKTRPLYAQGPMHEQSGKRLH